MIKRDAEIQYKILLALPWVPDMAISIKKVGLKTGCNPASCATELDRMTYVQKWTKTIDDTLYYLSPTGTYLQEFLQALGPSVQITQDALRLQEVHKRVYRATELIKNGQDYDHEDLHEDPYELLRAVDSILKGEEPRYE